VVLVEHRDLEGASTPISSGRCGSGPASDNPNEAANITTTQDYIEAQGVLDDRFLRERLNQLCEQARSKK
jgi:hypothetical protein